MRPERISDTVFLIRGDMPDEPFKRPLSSNCYVAYDNEQVVIFDTGLGPETRKGILEVAGTLAEKSKNLVVLNSHSHTDHCGNNDIVKELKDSFSQTLLLIHEKEIPNLDVTRFLKSTVQSIAEEFDPFNLLPRSGRGGLLGLARTLSTERAHSMLATKVRRSLGSFNTSMDIAEPLLASQAEPITRGGVTFEGWPLGRLQVFMTPGHSPGSISLYLPDEKVFLTSDLTWPLNPPLPEGSIADVVLNLKRVARMTQLGLVESMGEGHWHERLGVGLHRGEEVLKRLNRLIDKHRAISEAIKRAHLDLGPATVEEIFNTLKTSEDPDIKESLAYDCPRSWGLLRSVIVSNLRDTGCERVRQDGETIYLPKQ